MGATWWQPAGPLTGPESSPLMLGGLRQYLMDSTSPMLSIQVHKLGSLSLPKPCLRLLGCNRPRFPGSSVRWAATKFFITGKGKGPDFVLNTDRPRPLDPSAILECSYLLFVVL